jgi:hypothetical protein
VTSRSGKDFWRLGIFNSPTSRVGASSLDVLRLALPSAVYLPASSCPPVNYQCTLDVMNTVSHSAQ